ncbi:MAG: ribulose-phosphate 3-epimerase [Clostridia bacterium]|nr:ribulose-phosphate 3-epimerase [Clostridia bacterium]
MVEISTSLLSVEPENSIKTMYDLEVAHTDYFHIDVMDGIFVENNTSEKMFTYTNQIKQISNIPIDVHFMVENIQEYIEQYLPYEPNRITFHFEACKSKEQVLENISKIKENGIKVGISIKPNTNIKEIYEFLPLVHMVLIMTVEPGKGGQKLIPETLEKISKLNQYRSENNLEFDIQADGGINLDTIEQVKKAGVDIVVVGNGIIKTDDYAETIRLLKQK